MRKIRCLDYIAIHVDDVPTNESFYRNLFDLQPIPRPEIDFPGAWLRIGEFRELHLIGKNSMPDIPPLERHFAMEIDSATEWAAHLTQHAIEFQGPSSRTDDALPIFLRDPDGHVIELLERAPR